MTNPIVIDISHWQSDPIDWAALKANGTVGVIHKATEGTSYVDDKLYSRGAAALEAGLCWSTYHFFKTGKIQAQMDHYLATVDPRPGERMCIDHEEKASLSELEQAVTYLRGQRPDVQIAVYSGHTIKDQLKSGKVSAVLRDNTSLWLAQYTTGTPTWPTGTWPQWSLWQYTQEGKAVGINGNIDGNKWNGSTENLVKWFGPDDAVIPEPEPPQQQTVSVDIKTSGGVLVAVTLNGKPI